MFRVIDMKPGMDTSGVILDPYRFWGGHLNFGDTKCKKVISHFWHHNLKTIPAIRPELGTLIHLESNKMTLEIAVSIWNFPH